MLLVTLAGIVVVILELLGFRKIVVRMRNKLPNLRRNVNTAYLENRPNNRYSLVPYLGPIMSGLSAFLN